jgi:hypothetical protein
MSLAKIYYAMNLDSVDIQRLLGTATAHQEKPLFN